MSATKKIRLQGKPPKEEEEEEESPEDVRNNKVCGFYMKFMERLYEFEGKQKKPKKAYLKKLYSEFNQLVDNKNSAYPLIRRHITRRFHRPVSKEVILLRLVIKMHDTAV